MQIGSSALQAYSDAFFANSGVLHGGSHYPRGVTTSLWWLSATNNPPNPVPVSAPAAPAFSSAQAGDHQVLLLWQGVPLASAYNLKRGTSSGGPYAPLTNGLVGASFLDSGLSNGPNYYYILIATNQIGQSFPSPEIGATPVPAAGTNITASLNASTITISWPPAYVGWILQTNTVGLLNTAAWGDVPASLTASQMSFPVTDPNTPAQFFRLRHP
jgi:hypothetical protein